MAGLTINQAVLQWSNNPAITTLETISAPIEEIQFPTVTVCDNKPPDNWGPLEKVLNSPDFECSNPTSNCTELSKQIRKDFEFLVVSLLETYIELLNKTNYKTLIEAAMFKDEIEHYNTSGIIDIVSEVLKEGHYEDLKNLAFHKFANGSRTLLVCPTRGNYDCLDCMDRLDLEPCYSIITMEIKSLFQANYTTSDTFLDCTSEICRYYQEHAARILILLRWTRHGVPFGSFITQFIHLNNFKSFGSCRHDLCDCYTEMLINCTKLNENEKKLHEYFALLSKSFGFNESELLSLYELPGMLADDLDYAKPSVANGKEEDDNLLGDIPQAHLYSSCKRREPIIYHIKYSRWSQKIQQCNWLEDELNETSKYISK